MNKTVYPYGTDGNLPSSIGIINDLTTGGADKALSAEQGKVIGEMLQSSMQYPSDDMSSISAYDGKQFKADSSQIGKSLSSVSTYNTADYRNYRIPVKGAYSVTFRIYTSGSNYGCLFLDASDVVVSGVTFPTGTTPVMQTVGVPDGASYFIWSYKPSIIQDADERICTVNYIKADELNKRIDDLASAVDEIENEIGKTIVVESAYPSMTHYKDGYQLKADDNQIGKDIDDVPTSQATGYINVLVPVEGVASASFWQYGSGYGLGSLFIDENDKVLKGVVSSPSTSEVNVTVPPGAKYLVFSYRTSLSYDKSVVLYTEDGLLAKVNEIATKEPTINATGKSPDLTIGRVDSGGTPVSDNKYVITEPIYGAFSLVLADGWRVYEGHLVNTNGEMVSYQIVHPDVFHSGSRGTWANRTFFGTSNMVPEYGMRLVFCKSDQSTISEGEQPVKNFMLLSDSCLRRWIPADLPNYDVALRRVDYIQRLRWIPVEKVPNGYPASGQSTNVGNTYFDIAGRVAIGVPYSDVAETRKYVPNCVSLRTFMTATKNRRSLLYTEELNDNTSKYGMSYTTGNRRAYYGEVCCGYTNWVMGLDVMYLSIEYGNDTIPGLSPVTYNTVDDLRPLDLVWNDGHITIISDIWKDEFGKVKYVALSEMSTPYPYRTLYTPAQFETRMQSVSATVHRWTGWDNLQEPEDSEFSQYLLGQTRKEPVWNGDIMTFAGDYAAFAEGDIIHLNARRNSVYTGVELYKDDVLLQTIDITGLSADTIVTPNDEDWVDVNLTTLNLTYGKYKARLTDGTNTTDYTYFEVIGITMSATKSGNTVTVAFGSANGVPVSIEQVKANGFPAMPNGKYHAITAEEVSAGTMTLNWAYNSTYKYLLMLVRGDYGTVVKRISHPSA